LNDPEDLSVLAYVGELRKLAGDAADSPSLAEVLAALEQMPAELLIDGPPPAGELLLHRTLRRLRAESTAARRPGETPPAS
jgi:hypothetical protein